MRALNTDARGSGRVAGGGGAGAPGSPADRGRSWPDTLSCRAELGSSAKTYRTIGIADPVW